MMAQNRIPESVLKHCRGITEILALYPLGEHPFLELAEAFGCLRTAWEILEEETDPALHASVINWRRLANVVIDAATKPARSRRIVITAWLEDQVLSLRELAGPLPEATLD